MYQYCMISQLKSLEGNFTFIYEQSKQVQTLRYIESVSEQSPNIYIDDVGVNYSN